MRAGGGGKCGAFWGVEVGAKGGLRGRVGVGGWGGGSS